MRVANNRRIQRVLGTIALLGSLLPFGYALEIFKDFKNPDVPFWPNALGELVMCLIAITGVWIGIRFLRYASGRSVSDDPQS